MIAPKPYASESERLKELDSFSILRTLPESDYNDLTSLAAQICNTPISMVSLLENDCQWFKATHGTDLKETPRSISFCGHAINESLGIFIVEDATKDERFYDNPMVTGPPFIQFYAGVKLVTDNGFPLGTLCVVNTKPSKLNEGQIESLKVLAKQTMNILNLRKSKIDLEKALLEVNEKNQELESFASVAAHDIKSPLASIQGMMTLISEQYGSVIDKEGLEMLSLIENSAGQLQKLIDGLLSYTRNDNIFQEKQTTISVEDLEKDIFELFCSENNLNFNVKSHLKNITINQTALKQVLINLIANAIKYNDKEKIFIELDIDSDASHYYFYVKDNGPGIPEEYREKIFRIFEVINQEDRYGERGNGIGLATVKKIIQKCEGTLNLESEIGKGSTFIFSLKK
ncbi:ATP-binding protein [Gaetbulibacter sp. M240]|uniref:GAF domain-containing sensor histidine kinase n=1 Tax=Gaetbulibacter sp. M240 TaxID=3126511 RepID=UPI00374E2C28